MGGVIVSFTGHRPDKIAGYGASPRTVEVALRKALAAEILRLAKEGAKTFVSGMAPGVDLWAADEVLRLRTEGRIGADVRLRLAVPYENFERSFGAEWRPLYNAILERADDVVYLSQGYYRGCFNRRNDYLVDVADVVVAYYEGEEGGTRYTLRRAEKRGRSVINLHQRELFD